MTSRFRTRLPLILLTVSLLLCIGCGDDDPVGPTSGIIEIASTPDHLDAAWTLTGPADLERTGLGSATLSDMDAGEYTVACVGTVGWVTPVSATQNLDEGATLSFAGEYVQQGMIVITPRHAYQKRQRRPSSPAAHSISRASTYPTSRNLPTRR